MRSIIIPLIIATSLLHGCSQNGTKKVALGEYCYDVPREKILNSTFKGMLDELPLDRSVAELSISFSASQIADHILQYNSNYAGSRAFVGADLEVIVAALSPENIEYIESRDHYEDLWRGEGSYSAERLGRTIEWDEEVNLFRISYAQISRGWTFTNVDPREVVASLPSHQSVIGACRERNAQGEPSYSCLHKEIRGDVLIEYWVPRENFPLYREIDDFIFAKLESWKIGLLAETVCLPKGS